MVRVLALAILASLILSAVSVQAPSGETCFSDAGCGNDAYFCNFDSCSAESGKCLRMPEICTLDYSPVCGCDGETYSNECSMQSAGVSKDYGGECGNGCTSEGESMPVVPGYTCCEGLTAIGCDRPDDDGLCTVGCVGASYCTNCGDGICKHPENECNCPRDCSEDDIIFEEVKCIFDNTETSQKCYTDGYSCATSTRKCDVNSFRIGAECDSIAEAQETFASASWECYDGMTGEKTVDSTERCLSSDALRNRAEDYCINHCSGGNSCTVIVKGTRGEKLEWKSSCDGYVYTVMDGESEYAKFDCGSDMCDEGDVRMYTCPDGSQVKACECRDGTWLCIISPEANCRSDSLVDVEISPKIQKTAIGEWVTYKILIDDNHPIVRCDDEDSRCMTSYIYNIEAYPIYAVPVREEVEVKESATVQKEIDYTYSVSNVKVTGQPVASDAVDAKSVTEFEKEVVQAEAVAPSSEPLLLEYPSQVEIQQGESTAVRLKAKSYIARSHPFQVVVSLNSDRSVSDRDTATLVASRMDPPYAIKINTDKYTYDIKEKVVITSHVYGKTERVESIDIDAKVYGPDGDVELVDLLKSECSCAMPHCADCPAEASYCLPCSSEKECECTFTGTYDGTEARGRYKVRAVYAGSGERCPEGCICEDDIIICEYTGESSGMSLTADIVATESSEGGTVPTEIAVPIKKEPIIGPSTDSSKVALPTTYFNVVDLEAAGEYVIQEDIGEYIYLETEAADISGAMNDYGVMTAYTAYYDSPAGKVASGVYVFRDEVMPVKFIEGHAEGKLPETLFGQTVYTIHGGSAGIVFWVHENLIVTVRGPSGQVIEREVTQIAEKLVNEWKDHDDSDQKPSVTGNTVWDDVASFFGMAAKQSEMLKGMNAPESLGNVPLAVVKEYLDMHPSDLGKPVCGDGVCERFELDKRSDFYCIEDCPVAPLSECQSNGGYCTSNNECKALYRNVGVGMCLEPYSYCCLPEEPVITCERKCNSIGYKSGSCRTGDVCVSDEANIGSAGYCASSDGSYSSTCCCTMEGGDDGCSTGCVYGDKCVPFGTRMETSNGPSYCSILSSQFELQKDISDSCDNDYECATNSCMSGKCYDVERATNILEQIFKMLSSFFGSESN